MAMVVTSKERANYIRLKLASVIFAVDLALNDKCKCNWNEDIIKSLIETRDMCRRTLNELEEVI